MLTKGQRTLDPQPAVPDAHPPTCGSWETQAPENTWVRGFRSLWSFEPGFELESRAIPLQQRAAGLRGSRI